MITSIKLIKNYGEAIDLEIDGKVVSRFLNNGHFSFWGQQTGTPQYTGKWIKENKQNLTFKLNRFGDMIDVQIIHLSLAHGIEVIARVFENGSFLFWGSEVDTDDLLFEGRWN